MSTSVGSVVLQLRILEGPVLVSLGVIEDLQPTSLQKGRRLLATSIKRLRKKEDVAKNEQEMGAK